MQVQCHLNFNGRCEEAVEFYRGALGAEVLMLMRFKDTPDAQQGGMISPGTENKVMHATFCIGDMTLMASDGDCTGNANFDGFSLTLAPSDEKQAQRQFAALAHGGQVELPLTKTFWSPCFGMLKDRFGVSWMINVMQ